MASVDTTAQADEALPRLMTARDVATALCVSPRTVRRWAAAGDLEAVRLPRRSVRFTRRSVAGLLDLRNDAEVPHEHPNGSHG
jgi:excisionase family DNA binding protein